MSVILIDIIEPKHMGMVDKLHDGNLSLHLGATQDAANHQFTNTKC